MREHTAEQPRRAAASLAPHPAAVSPPLPPAGYCGLDAVEEDPDAPLLLQGVDTRDLLDISRYCENTAMNGALILFGLGCILRLLTALALAFCPRGLRLEPLLSAAAQAFGAGRRRRRQQAAEAAEAKAAEVA